MVKIFLPVNGFENREIEAEEGDLVLFADEHQIQEDGRVHSLTLGVFLGSRESGLSIYRPMMLTPVIKVGGIIYSEGIVHLDPAILKLQGLRELHFGQEKIVEILSSLKGYEDHGKWVSQLRKPYD